MWKTPERIFARATLSLPRVGKSARVGNPSSSSNDDPNLPFLYNAFLSFYQYIHFPFPFRPDLVRDRRENRPGSVKISQRQAEAAD
jgi:hypothetical protein